MFMLLSVLLALPQVVAPRISNVPGVLAGPDPAQMETAADLVRTLRPGMLIARDAGDVNASSARRWPDERAVHVYVDGVLLGGIDALDRIPARAVLHVRHLTPLEAMTHFGSGNSSGVIAVTTYADHPVRR